MLRGVNQALGLDQQSLDVDAIVRVLTARRPSPVPRRSNLAYSLPILGLAACGGGGVATPPPPPPPPPSVGPTAVADGPVAATAGAAAITGNVITNDTIGTGAGPTVSTVAIQGGASGTVGNVLASSLGDLTLGSNGAYSFTVANNAAVRALGPGQTQDVVFTYSIGNAVGTSSSTLTVRVNGVNDAPAATALTLNRTEDDQTIFSAVQLTMSDVDPNQTVQVTGVAAGTTAAIGNAGGLVNGLYGQLIVTPNGSVTYSLNNSLAAVQNIRAGQTVNDVFTVQVSDGAGGTATTTITVAVLGTNDAPVAVSDAYVLPSGTLVQTGNLLTNDTDPDGQALTLREINSVNIAATGSIGVVSEYAGGFPIFLQATQNGSFTYTMAQTVLDGLGGGQSFYDYYSYSVQDTAGLAVFSTVRFSTTKPGGNIISGTTASETLTGTNADDVISGSDGNDTLYGGLGRNTLIGGNGNDTLVSGLVVGNGNTVLNFYEVGRTEFIGGAGDDLLQGYVGNNQNIAIYSGRFADYTINTATGRITDNNLADGDDGTDTLININQLVFSDIVIKLGTTSNNRPQVGQPNATSLVVQDGATLTYTIPGTALFDLDNDPITYSLILANGSATPAWIALNQAKREVTFTPPAGTNQAFEIVVVGSDGSLPAFDHLRLFVWDDAVSTVTNATSASLSGTSAADQFVATGFNVTFRGSAGADTLIFTTLQQFNRVDYSASSAAITYNGLTNVQTGGDAEGDKLYGVTAITGSAFADTFTVGYDFVEIFGGDGDDVFNLMNAEPNSARFIGGNGDDEFNVSAGTATVAGGAGADRFTVSQSGYLTLDYTFSAAAIVIAPSRNIARGGDANGDTFSASNLSGGAGFQVTGTDFNDIIIIDPLTTTSGNGGDGSDILLAGRSVYGNGYLFGGDGSDTLVVLGGEVLGGTRFVSGDGQADTIILATTSTAPQAETFNVILYGMAETVRDRLDLSDFRDAQNNILDFQDILDNLTDTGLDLRLNLGNFHLENGHTVSGSISLMSVANISDISAADFIFSGGTDWQGLLPADILV